MTTSRLVGIAWGLAGILLAPVLLLEWFGYYVRGKMRQGRLYKYLGWQIGDIHQGYELVGADAQLEPDLPREVTLTWREL